MKHLFLCLWLSVFTVLSNYCQPVTCKDSAFRKSYSVNNDTVRGVHHIALSDNGTFITGTHKAIGDARSQGFLLQLDAGGKVLQGKKSAPAGTGDSFEWDMGIELKNKEIVYGGVAFAVAAGEPAYVALVKADATLQTIWSRKYTLNAALYNNGVGFICKWITETDNGDLILLLNFMGYFNMSDFTVINMVVRINGADGSIVWCKAFEAPEGSFGFSCNAFQQNNSLVVLGYMDIMPEQQLAEIRAVYGMKLSMQDGTLETMKRYRYANSYFSSFYNNFDQYKARKIVNGYELYGELLETESESDKTFLNVQFDNDLNITSSKYGSWVTSYTKYGGHKLLMDTAGNMVFLSCDDSGNPYYSLYSTTSATKRTRALQVPVNNEENINGSENGNLVAFKSNGVNTVMLNHKSNGIPVIDLIQITPNDVADGCTGKEGTPDLKEGPFMFAPSAIGWKSIGDNGLASAVLSLTEISLPVAEQAVCKVITHPGGGQVSLGNDTAKCNADSLILTATPGFSSYAWPNNYHLIQLEAAKIKVYPDKDTAYIVAATASGGCVLTDTVLVKVWHSLPIALGNDTSFCNGQQVVLDAGSGFVSYAWNTGASVQTFAVKQVGTYSVTGKDANGCVSADTIRVTAVYNNPVVQLPQKQVLCNNQDNVLDAGPGFITYRWQDGSAAGNFTVTQPGTYWVKVTDNHHCEAADTITVTGIAQPPSGFIDTDTAICATTTVLLQPDISFSSYVWSNGSEQSFITVDKAGIYSLQVTDANGCKGEAVITVSIKDCINSIYFPSAFTPDANGKNDLFRPVVSGNLLKYYFAVYNRWGQCIFSSHNPADSWNGTYKQAIQQTGSYVWMCNYRFAGDTEKNEKGTVILIR